ncbi:GNAT family N-acetyltransferase [Rhodobacteraceae bacterium Araon29]
MNSLELTEEDFGSVESIWSDLFAQANSENPFLSLGWNSRWVSSFGNTTNTKVHVVRETGNVIAIALVDQSKKLKFRADPFFADYANFLVHPDHPEAVAFLVDNMVTRSPSRNAIFEPMRETEGTTALFEAALIQKKLNWRRTTICPNPVVSTERDFSSYLATLKKGLRQDLKTSSNNLNKTGSWSFVEATNGNVATEIFKRLVKFHLARQSDKAGHSIFEETANVDFFRELLLDPPSDFTPHMSAIEHDGKFVSAAYSIICGNTFYYWIPSFDHSYRSISLGKLHIKCLIERCCHSNIAQFDFMGGAEAYKYQWAPENYDLLKYSIFRSALQAKTYDLQQAAKRTGKSLRNESPALQKVWRRLSKFGKN